MWQFWQFGLPGDERHVQAVSTKLHDRIAGRALGDFDLDTGIVCPILRDQLGEEAARDQGMDADTQATTLPPPLPSLRSSPHGRADRRRPLDEKASGLGEPTPRA